MKKLVLLFSHKLTDEQVIDAKSTLEIEELLGLPATLQGMWSNVPVDCKGYEQPFIDFVSKECKKGDYILIEGHYGLVFKMVTWAKANGYIPVYSYTKREYKSETLEDGRIKNIHFFKHIKFNNY